MSGRGGRGGMRARIISDRGSCDRKTEVRGGSWDLSLCNWTRSTDNNIY